MNELKFLEVMGKIDDDLIREADVRTAVKEKSKPTISKRSIYAFGSVAAAAVITVSSVAFYNAHNPSDMLADHSIVQPDNSDLSPNQQNSPTTNHSDTSAATSNSADDTYSSVQTETHKAVTTEVQASDLPSENATGDNTQEQHTNNQSLPDNHSTQPSQGTTQEPIHTDPSADIDTSGYYYQIFRAAIAPDADAYGEDELHIVSVIISGRYYYQLDSSEHPAHNISAVISDSDFGEYVGRITELYEHDDPSRYTVSSKEPNLAGAEVYYYAPADSSAVIIVQKGQQCSIFVFNGMAAVSDSDSSVFSETFKLYGANSADDIQSISFSVATPNGSVYEVTHEGTITDRNRINSIVDILYQLKTESNTDSVSATPQWVVDAWESCRENPDAYTIEDISFDITFKNGTVLKDIVYQPFIGNGYVHGMQELTPEQNTAFRALFQ